VRQLHWTVSLVDYVLGPEKKGKKGEKRRKTLSESPSVNNQSPYHGKEKGGGKGGKTAKRERWLKFIFRSFNDILSTINKKKGEKGEREKGT